MRRQRFDLNDFVGWNCEFRIRGAARSVGFGPGDADPRCKLPDCLSVGVEKSRVGWTLSPHRARVWLLALQEDGAGLWLRFEEVRERSAKERGDDVAPAESLLAGASCGDESGCAEHRRTSRWSDVVERG